MLSVVADERARAVLRGDLDELAREGATLCVNLR
jgi:hypothetical protein